MTLQRIPHSTRVPSIAALSALQSALSGLSISSTQRSPSTRRHASHQAQGRANGAKDGAGKRLGAKKTGGEYVVPGNILFKQRGTLWFPGDGCFMGRDHTIHAQVPGYVTYYRDPAMNPKRKYIGVVFERGNTLPQPYNAVRRRQLGMLAYQMPATTTEQISGDLADLTTAASASSDDAAVAATITRQAAQKDRQTAVVRNRRDGEVIETKLTLRPGYQWRQGNWEIGRAALRSKKAMAVTPFKPGDRWAAWRKRTERKVRNAERRAMGRGKKGKKKR